MNFSATAFKNYKLRQLKKDKGFDFKKITKELPCLYDSLIKSIPGPIGPLNDRQLCKSISNSSYFIKNLHLNDPFPTTD